MLRQFLSLSLASVLAFSLACSTAIRAGHADVPVAASAEDVQPLIAGDMAPRFVVQTVEGEAYDFNPASLEKPAIILVFRGGWCPYCNTYLSEMRNVVPEIRDMGIDVLFLSGDRSEDLYEGLEAQAQEDIDGLDYTILSDANAQAAIALGIAFRADSQRLKDYVEKKGLLEGSSIERHGVLPVPAVYAVGRDGTIAFSYVNPDYKMRLPADELMAAAREIAAAD